MTPTWQTPGYTPAPVPMPQPARRRSRVFMFVFLGIQVLFLALIISAAHGSHNQSVANCATQTALSAKDCQSASDAGTAIGVGLLVAFWAAVDVIIGITYAVVRVSRRR